MLTRVCEWAEDADGFWHTDCGGGFSFEDGTPLQNRFRFCCYCGLTLLERRYVTEADDE